MKSKFHMLADSKVDLCRMLQNSDTEYFLMMTMMMMVIGVVKNNILPFIPPRMDETLRARYQHALVKKAAREHIVKVQHTKAQNAVGTGFFA